MLTIEFGAEDLGRVRFAAAPAPLLETVLMLFELRQGGREGLRAGGRGRRPGSGPDWREAARSAFAADGRTLLWLAPSARRACQPDVLTPGVEQALCLVQAIPERATRDDADGAGQLADPDPAWPHRCGGADPVPLADLDRAVRAFHAACLAPRWPQVTAGFQRDVAQRTALMRSRGILAVLGTLSPDLRLSGTTLVGRYPPDRRVRLAGQGLVLMPSVFWTGHPLVTWEPRDSSRPVLIYPAGLAPARPSGQHQAGDPLGMLLGATRAAVLRALRQPRTTTALARQVQISPASASGHATTLRAAGLITSERRGQAVVHQITELGTALLWHDWLDSLDWRPPGGGARPAG